MAEIIRLAPQTQIEKLTEDILKLDITEAVFVGVSKDGSVYFGSTSVESKAKMIGYLEELKFRMHMAGE